MVRWKWREEKGRLGGVHCGEAWWHGSGARDLGGCVAGLGVSGMVHDFGVLTGEGKRVLGGGFKGGAIA